VVEIVIAGGGTGGHLFPGLAVAEELRRAGAAVSWLGARRGLEVGRVPRAGIELLALPVTGASGKRAADQVEALLRLPPAVLRAAYFLLRRQAGAVLAVGGYAAVPGALAAAAVGVPLVIQEQNAVPGVANRFLAPWATVIACGFEGATASFPSLPARWTGNPVRPQFFAVPPAPADPLAVLVMGGSQGSAFLNRALPDAFAILAAERRLPRIVHQAGTHWEAEVRDRYAAAGVQAEVVGFLEHPDRALAVASLVVARSGALTVCELAAARRAALLVPFAAAAHGHQSLNAQALAATGAAMVIEEAVASPAVLASSLAELLDNPGRLAELGERGAVLARPHAARDIAALVLQRAGVPASAEHDPHGAAPSSSHAARVAARDPITAVPSGPSSAFISVSPSNLAGARRQ
jgi:UDP-N-acetylglucosamine--N-acetylmuramyl-(pentapeptide) pyrophosphoryl-undecaprenol N-acetylglucosamine transferase